MMLKFWHHHLYKDLETVERSRPYSWQKKIGTVDAAAFIGKREKKISLMSQRFKMTMSIKVPGL